MEPGPALMPASFGHLGRGGPIMERTIAVVLLLAVLGAAPPPRLHRVERVLAAVPTRKDTLHVVATILRGQRGDPCFESVEAVRVVGRHHGAQYADTMPAFGRDAEGSLEAGVAVNAAPVAWGKVRGVVLNRTYVKYAPAEDPLPEWRYLAVKGHRLVPVSPWCDAFGQASPGLRLLAEKSFGWFTAQILVQLRAGRSGGGLAPVPERDPGSGLAMLPIRIDDLAARDSAGVGHATGIRLYRGPAGEAGDSLLVTAATRVEFGRACAEVGLRSAPRRWGALPPWEVTELVVVLKRLAVVVDGRKGFVEERDFAALGLETEE